MLSRLRRVMRAVCAGFLLCCLSIDSLSAAIIYRLDAGTLGLSDGTPVANWGSQTQATAGNRPTYRSAGMNGLPSVDFDGLDDFLSGPALANARTIFTVSTLDTGAGNLAGLIGNDNDSLNVRRDNVANFFRSEGHNGDGNEFYRNGNVLIGTVHVNEVANGPLTLDQSHVYSAIAGQSANYTNFTLGRANAALGRYWDGDVSEIIVFDQALTEDQRTGVASILATKWNSAPVAANAAQIAAGQAVLGIAVPEPATYAALAIVGLVTYSLRRGRR